MELVGTNGFVINAISNAVADIATDTVVLVIDTPAAAAAGVPMNSIGIVIVLPRL